MRRDARGRYAWRVQEALLCVIAADICRDRPCSGDEKDHQTDSLQRVILRREKTKKKAQANAKADKGKMIKKKMNMKKFHRRLALTRRRDRCRPVIVPP